ncbi:MAG: PriCT-2 domain-containing protein, partial [Lentisphaerota bacterium]
MEIIDKDPIITECSRLIFEAVAPDSDGPLRVTVGSYDNPKSFIVLDFVRQIVDHPELLDDNLHCGVSTYDGQGFKSENAVSTCGISNDVDYGTIGHGKPSKFATREEALNHINGLPLKPSALWDSGHGIQGVYLLDSSVLYNYAERAAMLLAAKQLVCTVTYSDKVTSPAQLFRLPGTVNDKSRQFPDALPVRGTILKPLDTKCRYSLEDIIAKFKPLADEISASGRASCLNSSRQGQHSDNLKGFVAQCPDLAKVTAALNFLNPDCSYGDWSNLGMALHAWDSNIGFELWDKWSSKGIKFKPGECQIKWATFTQNGGHTIATLFDLAIKNGWRPIP